MIQMTKKINFNVLEEVNPVFRPVWTSKYPYNILRGGRNSFKSSVISMLLLYKMLRMIQRGHKANVIILRKVASHIRDTVYQQIKWAISKFDLEDQFESRVSPFRIYHKATGSTFYFYGQDDVQKLKGNAVDDIIAVWYEEATEFSDQEEFDQNFATFARQQSPYVDQIQFFWSYNPPRNPYNWVNEWSKDLEEAPNYFVHDSNYTMDTLGFVTDQMLEEIERIKENDFDYYRFLYLGEPVGLGNNVYNFELFKQIDELPSGEFIMSISYALDTGHQQSATALVCIGLTNKNNVVVLDTYYYSPAGKVRKLAPDELSENIHTSIQETSKWPIYKRTIDSAEGAIRNQYYKDYGVEWHPIAKKKNVIMIENVVTLLAQGRVFVINNENNQIFLQQHRDYLWDEKSIRTENPKTIEIDDHLPDAFKYYVNDNLQELGLVW